ncbi:hypothetical protein EV356DRAFT_222881 [Viridothelium virens]|uniref:Uncharacterized protein n=1 Tax=Viridothelium virens TaxID=1048519 RepID=A0A6A6HM02_VIRVR|nr:hypothetical protein EV356DRAFT_222881 [Viridothelium virens]
MLCAPTRGLLLGITLPSQGCFTPPPSKTAPNPGPKMHYLQPERILHSYMPVAMLCLRHSRQQWTGVSTKLHFITVLKNSFIRIRFTENFNLCVRYSGIPKPLPKS